MCSTRLFTSSSVPTVSNQRAAYTTRINFIYLYACIFFATKFGHRIIPQRPSLVSINLKSPYPELAGLSLRNVQLIYKHKTIKYCEFGEMLFTHKGISGPIVLKLSALEHFTTENAYLEVDLKPALTDEILEKRILRDFEKNQNKNIKNALKDLLLQSLIPVK